MGFTPRPKILGLISEGASAWLVAGVGLCAGAAITAAISVGLEHLAAAQLRQRFELLANERASRLAERLDEQAERLDSLRRFFVYAGEVSRSDFNGFTAQMLQRTQAFAWVPRVELAQREAFEAKAQASGVPGYVIRELRAGELRPAAPRPLYCPVLYIRSQAHLQLPLGFDQSSDPARGEALRKAEATGKLAVSAPIDIIGVDPANARGLLLAMPVYGPGDIASHPGQAPQGFVTSGVSIRQLLRDGLPKPGEDNLLVSVRDVSDPRAPQDLFGTPITRSGVGLYHVNNLRLADRTLELRIQASDLFLQANSASAAPALTVLGGVLSVLLASLLYSLVSQRQRALALVAKRTAELEGSEQRLRNTHSQLRNVLDAATEVAIIATDLNGQITTFNAGAERMLGYRSEQVLGRLSLGDLHVHQELRERVQQLQAEGLPAISPGRAMLVESLRGEPPHAQQWSLVRRNGSRLTVNMLVTAVRDEQGTAVGHLAVCIDITESRRVHEALAARDRLLEQLSAEVPGGIYQFHLASDGRRGFTYVSRGMRDIHELSHEQLMSETAAVFERIHPDDLAAVQASIEASAQHLSRWRMEYRLCLPAQGLRWVRGEATPEARADGSVLWHGYLSDITDLKRVEEELRALSVTDALTGIYNRRYFQERLKAELERARREDLTLAVIMLDIDHFKRINDQFGHAVGDKVLQSFTRRIGQRVRRSDVFCRLGGEEFIILCPGNDASQAAQLAHELRQTLHEAPVDGVGVITASFGVAVWRPEEGADALLLRADAGVYAAKQAGRDQVVNDG